MVFSHYLGKSSATAGLQTHRPVGGVTCSVISIKVWCLSQSFPIVGHLPVPCKVGIHGHEVLFTDSFFPYTLKAYVCGWAWSFCFWLLQVFSCGRSGIHGSPYNPSLFITENQSKIQTFINLLCYCLNWIGIKWDSVMFVNWYKKPSFYPCISYIL